MIGKRLLEKAEITKQLSRMELWIRGRRFPKNWFIPGKKEIAFNRSADGTPHGEHSGSKYSHIAPPYLADNLEVTRLSSSTKKMIWICLRHM